MARTTPTAVPILVLDNGGGYLKAGLAHEGSPTVVEPNCSALPRGKGSTLKFGCDVQEIPNYRLYRPSRRGLLLDLEQQRAIWEAVLLRKGSPVLGGMQPKDCAVVVTEAPFTPTAIRDEVEEMLLDDFGFQKVATVPAPCVALQSLELHRQLQNSLEGKKGNPCCTLLDLGFSTCLVQPCSDGVAIAAASRRLNVGSRVLTNLLLERMKIRHFDLSRSWMVAEDVLASTAEVSPNFDLTWRRSFTDVKSKIFALPNFSTHSRGFLVDADATGVAEKACSTAEIADDAASVATLQKVKLCAERVAIPEALFRPQDFGVEAAGLPDLVQEAIQSVGDVRFCQHFGRVVLCGGLAKIPGLSQRLGKELQQLLPSETIVEVIVEDEPMFSTWRGAAHLALKSETDSNLLTWRKSANEKSDRRTKPRLAQ
eukprot:TRINITY_DN96028_c0_g1_i1.p1 TRINITY_DN96028_c0_g1~~TRINITY_DN96028_c0_g1_i1.p1  ORF type:complete len:426 (+),score=96.02 TRINITY_DN96028_c0_g1_i1:94-1371(+)